jgi:hypothetical protein
MSFPDAEDAYDRIPQFLIRRLENVNAPEVAYEVADARPHALVCLGGPI